MEEVDKIRVILDYEVVVTDLSRKSIIELMRRYELYYTEHPKAFMVDFNTFLNLYDNDDLMKDLHPDEQKILDASCYMIDIFEDLLNELDITIPDEFREDDEYDDDDCCQSRIYGDTYYTIEDQFKSIIRRLLNGEDVEETT